MGSKMPCSKAQHMRKGGYTAQQRFKVGQPMRRADERRCMARQIREGRKVNEGWMARQARARRLFGSSVKNLCDPKNLFDSSGVRRAEGLLGAGYTSWELREAGFEAPTMREAGFTIVQLVAECGCTAREIFEAGY